jgi:site-specific recombinase XerD
MKKGERIMADVVVPPIPLSLQHLPTMGGLVVPWITPRTADGRYLLGSVNHALMSHAVLNRWCGVCGRPLDDRVVLMMRLSDLPRQCTSEPAMHPVISTILGLWRVTNSSRRSWSLLEHGSSSCELNASSTRPATSCGSLPTSARIWSFRTDSCGICTTDRCRRTPVVAYARDLTHFFRFLNDGRVDVLDVGPAVIADFLDYLVRLPVRTAGKRQTLAAVTSDSNGPGRRRAATSINRTLAAVSSFFEFVITIEVYEADNPVRKVDDYALSRVPERHQPFMGKASRQRPVRRAMRVKTVRALPRPLAGADVEALLATLRTKRDRACCLLMLDGGLRPGEVLGIRIPEDLQYGQRRVHVAIVMIIPGVHGRSRVPTVSSTCTTRARSPRSATT